MHRSRLFHKKSLNAFNNIVKQNQVSLSQLVNINQNKNIGIIYVAFGHSYDRLAAHTLAYSRRFTNLPFCVLSNLSQVNRDKHWNCVSDVNFIECNASIDDNRNYKTLISNYSPFDITLYLDVDCVIKKNGIESMFNFLGDSELLFQFNSFRVKSNSSFMRKHYDPVLSILGFNYPIILYQGGFFIFKRSQKTCDFFNLWNRYWRLGGAGRDMPALACAVQSFDSILKVTYLNKENFFDKGGGTALFNDDVIIQHRFGGNNGKLFFDKFKLPQHKQYKPFDA